eukprot:CFRG1906T1
MGRPRKSRHLDQNGKHVNTDLYKSLLAQQNLAYSNLKRDSHVLWSRYCAVTKSSREKLVHLRERAGKIQTLWEEFVLLWCVRAFSPSGDKRTDKRRRTKGREVQDALSWFLRLSLPPDIEVHEVVYTVDSEDERQESRQELSVLRVAEGMREKVFDVVAVRRILALDGEVGSGTSSENNSGESESDLGDEHGQDYIEAANDITEPGCDNSAQLLPLHTEHWIREEGESSKTSDFHNAQLNEDADNHDDDVDETVSRHSWNDFGAIEKAGFSTEYLEPASGQLHSVNRNECAVQYILSSEQHGDDDVAPPSPPPLPMTSPPPLSSCYSRSNVNINVVNELASDDSLDKIYS